MEKKTHLAIALILGVPALRLVEVLAVTFVAGGVGQIDYAGHIGLGLVIGLACALTGHMVKLSARKCMWVLPLLAMAYAFALLVVTYPPQFFKLNAFYVSTMVLMDLTTWAFAVAGSAFVAYVSSRPRPVRARHVAA